MNEGDDAAAKPTGYEPLYKLKEIAADVWIADGAWIKFYGIPFPTRMTVVRLSNGDVWVHSPIDIRDELDKTIAAIGPVRYLIAPNWIHYAGVTSWQKRFPDALTLVSPGVVGRAAAKGTQLPFDEQLNLEAARKIVMEFSPSNNIVKLCLQAMSMEEKGKPEDAGKLFMQAWRESKYDFEKFISAHYVARYQKSASDKLKWLETALRYALEINNDTVNSALPSLYSNIAKCHEDLGDPAKAKAHYELAVSFNGKPSDKGPFYHGTKAELQVGDLLIAGGSSNYQPELKMNHIYFTALINGAGLASALAKGDGPERVYIVEPTGTFENDPNVTDKKFPGNPTRSYRSEAPLKIVGEVTDWMRQTPEELQEWSKKLANNKGKIIN